MSVIDVVVIGAGIHGAGVAQAAAAAGYNVLILEKEGVATGTSSKSSKLIHGGLRYLESYQFSLVRKSLKERAVLCRIAPQLVKLQPFYIPLYINTTRQPWQIRLGLTLYALLGGLHKSNLFKRVARKNLKYLDHLKQKGLKKVYQYYDGQTNDTKLTKAVIKSAKELGTIYICPVNITSIEKNENLFKLTYSENNLEKTIQAKVVVNAAGPWVNEVHNIVAANTKSLEMDLVQGTHIIINTPAPSGVYYLEAMDQRAVFVMPYEHDDEVRTMIGTTEKLFTGKVDDAMATEEEINYLLDVYQNYFPENINIKVIDSFAGLRVLPKVGGSMFSRPRDTVLHWAVPGMLTLYGGKLTAYRSTAELVIKKIKPLLGNKKRIAFTDQLYLNLE